MDAERQDGLSDLTATPGRRDGSDDWRKKESQERSRPVLLFVAGDSEIREQVQGSLVSEYTLFEAADRRSALALVRREVPRLVLLDLGVASEDEAATEGLATLRTLLDLEPCAKVIVITSNSDRRNAMAALAGGGHDFIEKPVDLDMLRIVLRRAAHVSGLEEENRALRLLGTPNGFEGILGVSPGMQEIFQMIRRISKSEVPVLITGERGTGKELIARAIHRRSAWSTGPFVAVSCGSIPEALLESELFGGEKGAFIDSDRRRQGKLKMAGGGTLFLDEVEKMSLGPQVKLLRFLQDGHQLEQLDGRNPTAATTRVIAATNENLRAAVDKGLFREDLYSRIRGTELCVPPLRSRGEDVLLLARAFLACYQEDRSVRATDLSP